MTTYLTRLSWDAPDDIQAIHRTLAHRLTGRTLWARPARRVVIVQADQPVGADIGGVTAYRSTTVRHEWHVGERLHLSGIVCPTVARLEPGRSRGVRRPVPVDDVPAWLARKLADAADVTSVEVEDLGSRVGRRQGGLVTIRWVGVSADVTVADPAALAAHLRDGVGTGKAYGAGLLLAGAT